MTLTFDQQNEQHRATIERLDREKQLLSSKIKQLTVKSDALSGESANRPPEEQEKIIEALTRANIKLKVGSKLLTVS